jgi:hypothetical protein
MSLLLFSLYSILYIIYIYIYIYIYTLSLSLSLSLSLPPSCSYFSEDRMEAGAPFPISLPRTNSGRDILGGNTRSVLGAGMARRRSQSGAGSSSSSERSPSDDAVSALIGGDGTAQGMRGGRGGRGRLARATSSQVNPIMEEGPQDMDAVDSLSGSFMNMNPSPTLLVGGDMLLAGQGKGAAGGGGYAKAGGSSYTRTRRSSSAR